MVTRKPLPENASPLATEPPRLQGTTTQDPWSTTDPNAMPPSPWDEAPPQRSVDGQQQQHSQQHLDVPDALRPGGANYANPPTAMSSNPPQYPQDENAWKDASPPYPSHPALPPAPLQTANLTGASDTLRPDMNASPISTETNPFKRRGLSQSSSRSASLNANTHAVQQAAPPTQAFGDMSLGEGNNNPWQPEPIRDQRTGPSAVPPPPPFPSDMGPEPEGDPWRTEPALQLSNRTASPARLSVSSGRASPAWDELPENQTKPGGEAHIATGIERDTSQDHNPWDDGLVQDKGKNKATLLVPGQLPSGEAPLDDWSLIDPASAPPPAMAGTIGSGKAPESSAIAGAGKVPELLVDLDGDDTGPAPVLPPRPRYSPRPVDSKSETYQIKKIRWHDHKAASNPRISPILVQNENGPCPLVALVNALTLTTPAEMTDTALVQVLKSREQISLGLLLDAVFDELMSPRRTSEDGALPDVGELYDFMKGLHTGMNVNPRFIPNNQVVEAFKRTSLTHLHPTERGELIPGTFEDTVEMELYQAFSIPLIHGWLPTKDDPAYDAFERQATSYDNAQNVLFREEELEHKLSQPDGQGLTEQEQQLYQDIITIRSFLETSATQLTPWGLEVITKAMRPGLVAILFRNDHFSTLYRHPQTQQLLALVTDAGYASHAEVVWESLTDINGLHTDYLSGDFRLVGGPEDQKRGSKEPEWFETGPSSSQAGAASGHQRNLSQGAPSEADRVQEDHDLALAMQMQEEEDERHRTEEARRKRERELSEQFIEQQAQQSTATQAGRTPNGRSGSFQGRGGQAGGAYGRNGSYQGGQGRGSPVGRNGNYQGGPAGQNPNSLVGPRNSSSNPGLSPNTATGRRASGQSVTQQVRPLVPPVIPPRRPGVTRAADDGVDDAPPTYEQAQSSTPYNPPPGHPSHPASTQAQAQSEPPQGQTEGVTGTPTRPAGQGSSSQWPGSGGRGAARPMGGVPPMQPGRPVQGSSKDCVLM